MQRNGNGYLQGLAKFRQRLLEVSADRSMRVIRPDGIPGKLKIGVRRRLLEELLTLQESLGIVLICPDEVEAIREHWAGAEKKGNAMDEYLENSLTDGRRTEERMSLFEEAER